jgi:hypothetical protein
VNNVRGAETPRLQHPNQLQQHGGRRGEQFAIAEIISMRCKGAILKLSREPQLRR